LQALSVILRHAAALLPPPSLGTDPIGETDPPLVPPPAPACNPCSGMQAGAKGLLWCDGTTQKMIPIIPSATLKTDANGEPAFVAN